ncbi:LytR/AlgR family response regulator transcription factor [Psychrobium sp. nBUS_13]|uniref:LytR/AlgR family response regulator transcription factor n=1 Tax=Psychrobium sp. nBUS_13 TaxID=3395319 RepID=UPI003EBFC74C
MSKLNHFQQYQTAYEIGTICLLFFINSLLLATSTIMEATRDSRTMSFQIWEPFLWELSSAISALSLFPLMIVAFKRWPIGWGTLLHTAKFIVLGSIVFSLLHVAIMVAIRESVYWLMGANYDFGDVWFELLYEYRKDLWSFIGFVIFIQGYDFIFSRLQGEATAVSDSEDEVEPKKLERLLVKKLGKEFIVNVKDIEWLESSGNYVNLHSKGRIYPMRATLTKLILQIEEQGFCRVHRSAAVNMSCIDSITPTGNGDSEIALVSGKKLNLSRRFKEHFKLVL